MPENRTRCVNGDLIPGDIVLSLPGKDYACLVGTVLSINKAGTPEHDAETGPLSDDVHVNFMNAEYSDQRIREIDDRISDLYAESTSFLMAPLDDTIMLPEALIRITDIGPEAMAEILDSEAKARAYCERVTAFADTVLSNGDKVSTEKLYSPLKFYLHNPREEEENGEYGMYELYDERYIIPHDEAWKHLDAIDLALRQDRDWMDAEHGLAEYLPDKLRGKIWSLFPDIEYHGNYLYCVATAELTAALTPEETAGLKSWWGGQLSDGWGESFEQRAIRTGREELYIVPWSSSDMFFIDTEREFRQRLGLNPVSAETLVQAAPPEPGTGEDSAVAELWEKLLTRLNMNLIDYFDSLRELSGREIADMAPEIGAYMNTYYYLTKTHSFCTSEVDYLLKFRNPLEVVADEFQMEAELEDHSVVMWGIFDRQDALQDYELVPADDPPIEAAAPVTAAEDERPSVLARLRQAEQEKRSHPPTLKGEVNHTKSNPER